MEADGVGGRDLAHHLLAARRREQPLLGAQFVEPLVQIKPTLMIEAEQLGPTVVLHLQPDGAVAFATVGRDVDRRADKPGTQQVALPSAQRLVQRPLAQGQGRMGRGQAQGLAVGGGRGPARAGEQPISAAGDLQRQRLGAGRCAPGAMRRRSRVGDHRQQRAGDACQAGDLSDGQGLGILVMGASGGDPFGVGGAPALEAGQPAVGQGQDAQSLSQAGDGGGNAFGRRLGQLRQGVVQRQQVQQQLQPGLGAARGMAAVVLNRCPQRAVQSP